MRNSSVKFLIYAFKSHNIKECQTEKISEDIEREVFKQSNKLVNKTYRKLSRKVIFGLKSEARSSDIVSNRVTIRDFVAEYRNSL